MNMGFMFNKIIPMEMLAQMPLSFVHRLRDLRLKQMEAEQQSQQNGPNGIGVNGVNNTNNQYIPQEYLANRAMIENAIDELS